MLGIDLNTSKSQLSRARRYLQEVLERMSRRAQPLPVASEETKKKTIQ
jgi:hypothetical protein